MAADAAHAGRLLRMFGAITAGVGALLMFFFGALFSAIREGGALFPVGLCASFALAGAIVFLLGVRSRARALALFRTGSEAPARVTAVGLDYMVRLNGRHPYRIDYEFDVEGAPRKGLVRLWVDDPPRVSVGDDVSIVYDEQEPSHNLLLSRVTGNERLRVAESFAATDADASDTEAETEALSESEAIRREEGGPRHP